MTKPVIVTRATKGSALTWTEGDSNFTNLQNATIGITDGTNSGTLDLNDTLTFTAGTNVTLSYNSSTKTLTVNASAGGITDVVQDTTPQLGGNLDVNGYSIVSASNGNIGITPNGSGNIQLTPSTGKIILGATEWPSGTGSSGQVLTSGGGAGVLSWTTVSGGATTLDELTDVVITAAATNDVLVYNGTNWVDTALSSITVGTASVGSSVTLTSDNTSNSINYPLFSESSTGNVSPKTDTGFSYNPSTGLLTTITITTTGALTFKQPIEVAYSNGNSGAATITPNAANGSVQKYTLTGNITWNAFGTPVTGQSMTMILTQDATGGRTLTSTMKFSGGSKTLSTAANAIDIITVYYDGTTYYASLAKGFA